MSDTTEINIHPKFVTVNEVKAFYNEIIASEEARDYENSVREILLSNKKRLFPKRKVKKY